MKYSKAELIKYRMDRAKEAYEDAVILAKNKRWNSAANRLYYSCYYIVSAYLALKSLKATTHAGLKSTFNLELVKTGKIRKQDGILFNKLFGIRQESDYEDFAQMTKEELQPLIPKIKELMDDIEGIIHEQKGSA